MTRPLEGLVVVSLEQAVAAPLCSRHLGDMGARVIKVENVATGDFTRGYDGIVNGLGAHFAWLNRNKESLSVDLKQEAGRTVLEQLIGQADIVIQNLGPGAATRLGVAAADVVARHPSVIAVDISGYGVGGPFDARRAYDVLAQAEGGSCAITGFPGAPAKPGIPVADVGAAMYALSSILAALHARNSTGKGSAISVAMLDVIGEWMGFALNFARYGQSMVPDGVSSPTVAPYSSYPTNDGQTVVLGTTNDVEWARFAEMIGRRDLLEDATLASNALRVAVRQRLNAEVASWTSAHTLREIQAAADAAGIGHARLNQVADVLTHPQLTDRGRWVDCDSPVGPVTGLLPPPIADGWSARTDPIPDLGANSEQILAWLGYGRPEVESMLANRVIRRATPPASEL